MAQVEIDSEEDEDSAEGGLTTEDVGKAVVFSTDWTVGTILDQLRRKKIDIGPRFQRRDAWPLSRKSRYIESLMLQFPVPHIVLAEVANQRGAYIVLDGRQRLLSLMQFSGVAEEGSSPHVGFRLKDLLIVKNAVGRGWDDLAEVKSDVEGYSIDLKNNLENSTIRTVVVRNWIKHELLHQLFTRLNTETTRLNAQELRLAAKAGLFVNWVDDKSVGSAGLKRIFNLPDNGLGETRMKDVELLVRYFAFHNNFAEYRGPMRTFLDSSCDVLNRDFQGIALLLEHQLQHFERAVELGYEVFGDQFGHGWDVNKGTWSKKKNMAVLDVVVHYLSLLVKRGSEGEAGEVKVAVERLLRDEGAFQESIRQTARHGRESPARFRLLGRELVDSGVNVPVTGGA